MLFFLKTKTKTHTPGDIIILYLRAKNLDDMIYSSWYIVWQTKNTGDNNHFTRVSKITIIWGTVPEIRSETDIRNFLSFWTIFCPFTPLTTRKIKILKKRKQLLEIISFYMCTISKNHMMYGSWDMERDRYFFYHFGPFFALLPPQQPKKSKCWKKKKEKKPGDNTCYIVPETWHGTDVIIFHFGLYFLSFYPPNSQKNQN